MKPVDHRPSALAKSGEEIAETAAAWFARCYGGLSPEETADYDRWIAADPRHAAAIHELESVWQVVSSPGQHGQGEVAQQRFEARQHHRVRQRRRFVALTTCTVAVAALLVIAFLPSRRSNMDPVRPPSVAVRPDLQTLPDGSLVHLNAGAEIAAEFDGTKRFVRLIRGEALFTVVKDVSRPFVVSAGEVEVLAVGTAFAVRYDPREVNILVTEGTVAVERHMAGTPGTVGASTPSAAALRVTAGQRTVVPLTPGVTPTLVAQATPAETSTALAWRYRRIEFTRTPLAEALELLNQNNTLQLVAADAKTGRFEISGIFWADDPDSFARLLESAFNMNATRVGQKIVLRSR